MTTRPRRIPGSARACALAVALVLPAMSSAAAQEPDPEKGAWDMERAFEELERLEAEVALLRRLGEAQAELLAWNHERADAGAGPAVLSARLCAEPGLGIWCGALPATFGAGVAKATGHGKDGER